MSNSKQFDKSDTIIGGLNVIEAFQEDSKLFFNESYTILGDNLSVPSIYANYDLTIIGNIEIEEIEVKGNLRIIGNAKIKNIKCLNDIFCSGDINAETIACREIIANNIICQTLMCSGNVITKTTIDISEAIETEKSIIAGEGIVGNGTFSAINAVAAEYFDFSGKVIGKVLELETDSEFGKVPQDTSPQLLSFDEMIASIKKEISNGLQESGIVDEEQLLNYIESISLLDENFISDWYMLTKNLVEISYLHKISNLRDYLYLVMALKILPNEITNYETLAHIFSQLKSEAEKNIDELVFKAKDVEDFAYSLKIINHCEKEINIDKDTILDLVFQSIGIKYKTVKSFWN